ncbi:MAG: asparaginase domain-containing protein [Burkholderiaceae bacterium]
MAVRIICTGGTFNKVYNPLTGELTFSDSQVSSLLKIARCQLPVTELMLIDSLDMTDTTRQHLVDACRSATESRLVIVHGTDTMVESASTVNDAALNKTIVFTGAMVPNSVNSSDASFNLGYAIAAAQHVDAGVWVAMNAQLHQWQEVRKNRELGVFEQR